VDGIEVQLREQRQEMKAGFERVEDRFERVEDKFQRMQRAMTQAAVGLSGSIVLGFATVIAAVLLGA
jgi:hypothetical protein